MKGKKILALASLFAGVVLVGTTFAASAWAVTDNAGTKTIKISGEKINAADDTYYVTLDYGEHTSLSDVANLVAGTMRYAGKAGLVATYTGAASYKGLLSLSMTQPGARNTGPNLIDYVKVYATTTAPTYDSETKVIDEEDRPASPIITVQKTAPNGSSSISMTSGSEQLVYFVVEMLETGVDASVLNTIKSDLIEVAVNWNHDTTSQPTVEALNVLYKPTGAYNDEVYCYAFKGKVPNADYPGVKMTKESDGVYSYSINLSNFDSFILSYNASADPNSNVKARAADFVIATETALETNKLSSTTNFYDGSKWTTRPAADPDLDGDYYIVGTMTSPTWACKPAYVLTETENLDDGGVNHTYQATGVSLTAGDKIKVRNNSNSANEEWYWNANTWDNCYFTLDGEGNLQITATGTYTVTLYRTSNANNCVILSNFVAAA